MFIWDVENWSLCYIIFYNLYVSLSLLYVSLFIYRHGDIDMCIQTYVVIYRYTYKHIYFYFMKYYLFIYFLKIKVRFKM